MLNEFQRSTAAHAPSEADLARQAGEGDEAAFTLLMRHYNRRLFRVARGILKNDSEAEEAVQEGYVTAYFALRTFRGDSKLTTWLTRIVINKALTRLRQYKRDAVVVPFAGEYPRESEDPAVELAEPADRQLASPEEATMRAELRALLERKIDELPMAFRTVFIMRELEEMTVEETAACLQVPEATVRTRLFRAKGLLREALAREIDLTTPDAFGFAGERCDRIVTAVLARLAQGEPATDRPR